ncbi:MAG: hypothetical protein QGG17_08495 [Rhodospirillales bacterium]|jgi:hypothetical protein|nr:hypothetical protein [Rhodospirillales bacterium]MDP6805613.1 hypothetical protein [Rhodospirillales bacterium]
MKRARAISKPDRPGTARGIPYPVFVGGYAIVYGAILVAMTLYDVAGTP